MKKILGILFVGILLSGCGIGDELRRMDGKHVHSAYYKQAVKKNPGFKYYVLVKSPGTDKLLWGASNASYNDAFNITINQCKQFGLYDCVPHTRGWTYIYNVSREDKKIAYAQNVCRKVGYSPGTNDFRECTIKIISANPGQQTVVVGSGNRQQLLRPYPLGCRSMGGMANC